MSSTVNIGTLQGTLAMRNAYSAEFDKFDREIKEKLIAGVKKFSESSRTAAIGIQLAYERIAASLDPAVAKSRQYQQAQIALQAAFRAGIITQEAYNRQLDLAKEKYLSASVAQKTFAKNVESLGESLSQLGTSLSIGISAPLAIIGGLTINTGRAFETSFAGVRKTVDGTEKELEQLSVQLREMAAGENPIPINVNTLNEVAESAGQLGIARQNIVAFTRVMADLGETTNLTAVESSESIAQFQNIFGQAGVDVDRFGSTLVALGNAGASTEKSILQMGVRIAGAGKQIGLTQGQVLAISSALSSVGIEAEAGGSAISKVLIDMSLAVDQGGTRLENFAAVAGMTADEFKNSFQVDAAGALNSFISGLGRVKEQGGSALGILDQMEISEVRMRDALLRAAGAGDLLSDSLSLQSEAWQKNTALTEEAAKRYETFDSKLVIFKNKAADIGITLGQALLPVLSDTLDLLSPLISVAKTAAELFSDLPAPIKAVSVAFGALAISIGPVVLVTGQLLSSYGSILSIAPKLITTFPAIGTAVSSLLGPFGLLLIAIGAVTIALATFISKWKSEMQGEIEKMVRDTNLLGSSLDRLRNVKFSGGVVSSSDLQGMSDELAQISDQIENINKHNSDQIDAVTKKYNDQIAVIRKVHGEDTTQSKQLIRFRDEAAKKVQDQNRVELQGLESRKKLLIETLRSVESITGAEEKQTETTVNLSEELSKADTNRAEKLKLINSERELELERLNALRLLAEQSPLDLTTRLIQEKKINDEHEYRLSLLRNQAEYGNTIGKQLADQEKELKDITRKVTIELQLAMELKPIKIDNSQIQQLFNQSTKDLDSYLGEIIDNEERNREEYANTFRGYDDIVESTAATWVDNLKSMKDISEEEMFYVREAVERGLLSVSEGERAIAMIREQQYSNQINQWAGFLSQLGDQLGGFFSQIASLAQSVQGVNSTAQALGGWASMMGAWGGTIAAFVAAYQYADAIITKHKGERYGTRSEINITSGIDSTSYGSRAGMELSRAMAEILEALEDSLRISVEDLQEIEIRVRNNGESVQAWVKGVWVGTFSDVNTAMKEALLIAMQDPDTSLRGMSDLMLEGLSAWTSPDMEEMLEFITDLRSISDLSLSPAVIQLQSAFLEFNRMRDALNKLDQSSKAVIDAQKKLTEAQNYLFEQTKAQLLGIDITAADAIRNLAGFNEGMQHVSDTAVRGIETALHAAERELKKIEDEAKKGEVRKSGEGGGGKGTNTGTGTGGPAAGGDLIVNVVTFADTLGGVSETIETESDRLKGVIADYKRQLSEVPKALTENEIDLGIFTALESSLRASGKHADLIAKFEAMRVDAQFQALKLQLIAIGAWERWSAIWQELYDQAMKTAGKGGRVSGAGNSEKDQVKDFIRDKNFELSLIGLTDYQKSLKELDKQYEDLFKQAGKDKKLRDELIALKERELQQLAKENKLRTVNTFKEFLGLVTPFDKVRKTAADLIKEISASPFGDARKAAMIGRVMEETERQLDRLSKEMSVSLFGSLLSDMEQFGATDAQMMEARKQMAILEHGLRMENYRVTIAQLEAEGRVSAEVIAAFKKGYDFLAAIDPTKFITPANDNDRNGGGDSVSYVSQAYDDFQDRLKKVQDTLAEWNRVPLSETLSRAHELTDSFSSLMEDVNKLIPYGWNYTAQAQEAYRKLVRDFIDDTLGEFEESGSEIENELLAVRDRFTDITAALVHLGATQEDLQRTEEARLTAVRRVLEQYLDPIKEHREGRNIGERSTLTGEQQFKLAQEKFRDLFADIQSGDLSRLDETVDLASQYEELMRAFTGGEGLRFGLKEIDDTLLAIENLVPDFAAQMAEVGSESNPMNVDSASMVNAIHDNMEAVNAGNNLMLTELRENVTEIKRQTVQLQNIESAIISNGLIRNIA